MSYDMDRNMTAVAVRVDGSIQDTSDNAPLLHHHKKNGVTLPSPAVAAAAIKTYRWRWVVLGIFTLNQAVCNYIWIMSASVADLMVCYYGVSETLVNFTTTSYMMMYLVLMWPATWLMDKYGLRLPAVLASASSALGASLRVIGTSSQSYWILLLGQFIAATSNAIFFGGGPLLSETWFPSSERSTATAIGASIGPQIGILVAMGLTPAVLHNPLTKVVCNKTVLSPPEQVEAWEEEIYSRWLYYQCAVAVIAVLTLFLTVGGFYNAPPTPPSLSRQLEKNHREEEGEEEQNLNCWHQLTKFLSTLLLFAKNGYFMLYLVSSGILVATAGSILSIINEIVSPYFHDDKQIGYLGVLVVGTAIIAMLAVGRILDLTKRFYLLNVSMSFLGTLCLAALILLIQYQHHFYFLYIAVVFVGVTISAYQALAYEYAVEMTYPLPEATSAGLVNFVSQAVAIVMILLVTPKHTAFAMWFVLGTTAFGALLTVFIRPKLKRAAIDKES